MHLLREFLEIYDTHLICWAALHFVQNCSVIGFPRLIVTDKALLKGKKKMFINQNKTGRTKELKSSQLF